MRDNNYFEVWEDNTGGLHLVVFADESREYVLFYNYDYKYKYHSLSDDIWVLMEGMELWMFDEYQHIYDSPVSDLISCKENDLVAYGHVDGEFFVIPRNMGSSARYEFGIDEQDGRSDTLYDFDIESYKEGFERWCNE